MRVFIVACFVAAGCGGGGGAPMPPSGDPAAPAHGYQIKTPDYSARRG